MKSPIGVLLISSILILAGCSHTSRSSGGYLSDVSRHPSRHEGELLASLVHVQQVREEGGGVVFRASTQNYAYSFVVSFPSEVPGLAKDTDVYFLGRVAGSVKTEMAYSGTAITIDAIAVRPVGGQMVARTGQEETANAWLRGDLDVSDGGDRESRRVAAYAPPPPAEPAPSYVPTPALTPAYTPPTPAPAAPGDAELLSLVRTLMDKWPSLPSNERTMVGGLIRQATPQTANAAVTGSDDNAQLMALVRTLMDKWPLMPANERAMVDGTIRQAGP